MTHNLRIVVWVCALTLALLAGPALSWGQDFEWIRQFGTGSYDYASGVTSDATGVYVVGSTFGQLPGQTNVGVSDAFVCKYDPSGTQLWCRQFGSWTFDSAEGVASDPGGIYVVGSGATFSGQSGAEGYGSYVCKFDADGTRLWCRQFGLNPWDGALGVASGASGVYVAGVTYGTFPGQTDDGRFNAAAFLCQYDTDGNQSWCRQFGTSWGDQRAQAVASDASGVYVAGYTNGTFPGQTEEIAGAYDAFVCKYDTTGTQLWCRLFGTTTIDWPHGVASDPSGVYVAGYTDGTFPGQTSAGGRDAFVCKYDHDGNQAWCRQLGTAADDLTVWDGVVGIASDAGGIYVAGNTTGTFPGQSSTGNADAFVCQYNPDGIQSWCVQFGTTDGGDYASSVTSGPSGMYLAGWTDGTFPGQTSAGQEGASWNETFVAKLGPANEVPTADAGPDQTAIAGESVMFDGTGSYDPDGTIASYDWTFGDGGTVNAAIVGHVYATAGSFTATLTVTDDDGATDDDTAAVTVLSTAQAIGALSDLVAGFNFQQGISNSLDAKLDNALDAMQAANAGQRQDAANKLMAFINSVNAQQGKEISDAQADALIALARRILAVI